MNKLELAAIQAILNRATLARDNYERSNKTGITETQADNFWSDAKSNMDEMISLLHFVVKES